jgi:hypothetical protein
VGYRSKYDEKYRCIGCSFAIGVYLSIGVVSNLATGLCGNELLVKAEQPDSGIYDLVQYKRDRGATTGVSYHLSIIKHGNELKYENGNVYISDSEFTVQWIDKNTVMVANIGQHHFKQIDYFKDIDFQYSLQ